ncbi:hypothetical protein [Roseateles sp. YR242]|uniref:hypothetical protein n=1 Tax=Roseateles sp. YR242 TaxID=1855305 RepID=UPI001160A2DD|nr:hypothetical protein [Roseateles sp. YR242]
MNISEEMALEFLRQLKCSPHFIAESTFNVEYQDDGEFILILMDVPDGLPDVAIPGFLGGAQEIAKKLFPCRIGAYGWMMNIGIRGQVVNSVFGGDSLYPNSGYIDRGRT